MSDFLAFDDDCSPLCNKPTPVSGFAEGVWLSRYFDISFTDNIPKY